LIASELGLPSSECELVLQAARLHDVGKLAIPESILLKPGRLETHEVQIMRTHATHGHKILADSSSAILRAGGEIALCHHERFDGSGYPAGLRGGAIPLYARIVAVADVFDALTTRRAYKEAWDVERAARAMREGCGSDFDPACVTAFFQAWQQVLEIKARYAEIGLVSQ
jgi:response regulator RpfG family c-di-GMP phosphodiesterase